MIVGHNLLDARAIGQPVWTILHSPGFVLNTPSTWCSSPIRSSRGSASPPSGYGLGAVYSWDAERRRAFLLRLGLALTVAFLVLRGLNGYGDPAPWTPQRPRSSPCSRS